MGVDLQAVANLNASRTENHYFILNPSLTHYLSDITVSQVSDGDGAAAAPPKTAASSRAPRRAAAAKKTYQESSEEEDSEIELMDEDSDDDFEA